ncbi:MAG: pantoate--beta-alanine ligase [Deferrisomatales bacterium]
MEILERVEDVRAASRRAKARGERVVLVPTMGYLHEGHLTLVRRARELGRFVVVSIFVNPTQFGPQEDLDRYPRDMEGDAARCREEGVDVVFAPTVAEMYPDGYQTYVTVERLSQPLCGASRPGHFRGVATVVAKLFHMVEPDVAVFGEKDFQQLQVIRRMVRDLNMGVEIVGVPTVREPDGLAMSSRNAYLDPDERRRALALSQALDRAQERVAAGERRSEEVLRAVREVLDEAAVRVDYAELRDPESLEPVERVEGPTLLALAGFVGQTRLIDNRVLRAPGG